jgi:hypothetical protein
MQVKPFEPERTVRMEPSELIVTTAASLAIIGGAADVALAMIPASPVGADTGAADTAADAVSLLSAWLQPATARAQAPNKARLMA